jgi:RNA recognition motif-containing protein
LIKFLGRSRGFGFVQYEDEENAQKAVKEMTDTDLDGKVIRCGKYTFYCPILDIATDRGGRGGDRGGRRDDRRDRGGFRGKLI